MPSNHLKGRVLPYLLINGIVFLCVLSQTVLPLSEISSFERLVLKQDQCLINRAHEGSDCSSVSSPKNSSPGTVSLPIAKGVACVSTVSVARMVSTTAQNQIARSRKRTYQQQQLASLKLSTEMHRASFELIGPFRLFCPPSSFLLSIQTQQ